MADTWEDLVHDAIVEIGAKSDGEQLTNDERESGLRRLKGMLEQWTQDGLLIPQHKRIFYNVDQPLDSYRFGAAGTLSDGSDPEVVLNYPVEEIDFLMYKRAGRENDYPLRKSSLTILESNHSISHQWPTLWSFERDHPLARLYFNTPTQVGDRWTMHYTSVMDTSFDADDEIGDNFPPGYREAILLNLAVKLAPSYGVKDGRASGLSSQTKDGAKHGLRLIRKRHVQVATSIVDPTLLVKKDNQIRGNYRGRRRC